jgi:enoyl-[acyl-carrier protein] reductase I
MKLLHGKRILIVGVASKRSIAYGIAQQAHAAGAELAFTYQGDKLKERVIEMAADFGSTYCYPCDVGNDEEIQRVFTELNKEWPTLDGIIHSVGFAPGDQLDGDFTQVTTREGFRIAHDISAYSLIALCKAAHSMLSANASIVTLTYHGSTQTLPNYNVMGMAKASLEAGVRYLAGSLGKTGIRVNAISAGPIRTLAASGIKSFRKMLKQAESRSPLKRNVSIEEVGDVAVFLCSPMSSGMTGEVLYVDAGFRTCAISEDDMEENA